MRSERYTTLNKKKLRGSQMQSVPTAMLEADEITKQAGQKITVFAADQQLYRVASEVMWTEPNRFQNFIPRIGSMHWIMSLVGSIGVLMKNSGLIPWLKSGFGVLKKC